MIDFVVDNVGDVDDGLFSVGLARSVVVDCGFWHFWWLVMFTFVLVLVPSSFSGIEGWLRMSDLSLSLLAVFKLDIIGTAMIFICPLRCAQYVTLLVYDGLLCASNKRSWL